MNQAVNDIAAILLQKELKDADETQLRRLAEAHPYFAAAQLLLAAKLQQNDDAQFSAQLQKTFLYVQPPLRLQHLLYSTGDADVEEKAGTEIIAPVIEKEEPAADIPVPLVETTSPAVSETIDQVPVADAGSKTILPEELPEQPVAPSLEETELVIDQTPPAMETAYEEEPLPEGAEDDMPARPIPGLKIEPIDPAKAELNFTPYHTVDYFASLGIRMREEEKPSDSFGRQLKSFTEWIKVMRKLPTSELNARTDAVAEKKVEILANDSVTGEQAETEAMAEVWEKQGNITRAVALYQKLSLQDPAKSAYFASKIEELKKKN
ncbi:hypothetical protein [Terrimonas ferruginea]|uniref:hypothetical protein n=1 Tax=Terrimonas ferruginea TaxID=249 RepID=UPI0003F5F68D|nr:hypothetical protein [Terrimonas ferruginea]